MKRVTFAVISLTLFFLPPTHTQVGVAYMLEGYSPASNSDPGQLSPGRR